MTEKSTDVTMSADMHIYLMRPKFWSEPFGHPFFVNVNSEVSGETANMCRLFKAFATYGCEKYQSSMC